MGCIGQNSLDRTDLGFIFLKTSFDGVDDEGRHHLLTHVHRRICDVGKGRHGYDFHGGKLGANCFDRISENGHIAFLSSGTQTFQPLCGTIQIQTPLQAIQSGQAGLHILFKLAVVESHFNNPFVNSLAHDLVTSFHA